MKKKLIYFFIGFIILVLLAYLLRYKTGADFKNKIPTNATAIVNVDLRQLEHHFLVDFISNPSLYLKSSKSSKKDTVTVKDKPSLFKAVEIPKNILFYAKNNNNSTWISSKLTVKNKKQFTDFLINSNFKPLLLKEFSVFTKQLISILINDTHAIITYNVNSNDYKSLFNESTYLSSTSLLFKKLKKSKSAICYVSESNDFLETNFKVNTIEIKGAIQTDLFKNTNTNIDTNAIGIISTNLNTESQVFKNLINTVDKSKFKSNTKLSIDSLIAKWNGSLYFNLNSFKIKTDTIKTYEYDDDFNKIETIKTQKTSNPDFILSLGNNNSKTIYNYLEKEKSIKIVGKDTIFVSLPIVKTFANNAINHTNLFTSKTLRTNTKTTDNKLFVDFNFKEYRNKTKNTLFYYFNKIDAIEKGQLSISKKNELLFKLEMKDKNRNALVQLIKN